MAWCATIQGSSPPLRLEIASGGFHGYSTNNALKVARKQDAVALGSLFIEGLTAEDDGGPTVTNPWVLSLDGSAPKTYLEISSGFFEWSANTSAALQFASKANADAFALLLTQAHISEQL